MSRSVYAAVCSAKSSGVEVLDDLSQDPDAIEGERVEEEFFFARARSRDVEAWEGAAFHEFAVEVEFAVAGAFEFFEDDFVHARAGVDEGGRDDGERSAVFDVSCSAEEALWFVQGVGVDAAGEDFARGWDDGVRFYSESAGGFFLCGIFPEE